jgi:predicted signal transduction protein with EAL and GGDEF domain
VELVAEGIEREAEAAFLEREGIVTAQGYLYCRPLPLDDVCAFLDRERRAVSKAAWVGLARPRRFGGIDAMGPSVTQRSASPCWGYARN